MGGCARHPADAAAPAMAEEVAAAELRDKAFEEAPATGGTMDGDPFVWIADADTTFGPMVEAIIISERASMLFPSAKATGRLWATMRIALRAIPSAMG